MKSIKGYIIEAIVIISSVMLSLYLGNINDSFSNEDKKRNYLIDLSSTLEEDIKQIKNLIDVLNNSENLIIELQNDIDKNTSSLSFEKIINNIIEIEVDFSFFP